MSTSRQSHTAYGCLELEKVRSGTNQHSSRGSHASARTVSLPSAPKCVVTRSHRFRLSLGWAKCPSVMRVALQQDLLSQLSESVLLCLALFFRGFTCLVN